MKLKHCSGCNKSKPIDQFYKNRRMKDGLQNYCKTCLDAAHEKWKGEHQERRKEYEKQWHVKNIVKRKSARSKRESNRWKNDPEYRERKNKQKLASYYRSRKDSTWLEKAKVWWITNSQRRRARELKASGSHTQDEWKELCNKYDHRCLACGKKKKLTLDHIVPISKGGSDSINNIQCLCTQCNCSKGTRTIDYRPDRGGR